MQRYRIRITKEAESDLAQIYRMIRKSSASTLIARRCAVRIRAFLDTFSTFPERGSVRDSIRPGLRIVGFERRISVAFVVETEEVVILRILYAGRQFNEDEA